MRREGVRGDRPRLKGSRPTVGWAAVLVTTAAGLLLIPGQADAQVHFGPQMAVGSDSGLGLGGRLLFPLRSSPGFLDGAVDGTYFLGGEVDSWIDANLNVRFAFPLAADFTTRLGAGANASFISIDEPGTPTTSTDTEFGLNVLFGFEYPRGGIRGGTAVPFGELRAVIGGAEQVILTVGLTFGPRAAGD